MERREEEIFKKFIKFLLDLGIQEIKKGRVMADPISHVDYLLSLIEKDMTENQNLDPNL